MIPIDVYRIGWWPKGHWWPTRNLLNGLLTGNQLSPRADNGSHFVGRRAFVQPIISRLCRLRWPNRPWQAAAGDYPVIAHRGFTRAGAARRAVRAATLPERKPA